MTETEMPDVGTSASRRPIERSTILITGATDGLGKGVATELAKRGATVLVHGRAKRRIEAEGAMAR